MHMSGYWQDLRSDQLQGLDPEKTIAVMPVSAVEQHGPHLPLCTDAVIIEGIVDRLLQAVPNNLLVLVLPALTIGHSLEHRDYPGTLTASAETLLALWIDIGRCAARSGLRKLIILNSHGGQSQLVDIAALRLRAELGMLTARADYFRLGAPDGLFDSKELAFGIHGGEVETSLMLHLRPDLVQLEALNNFEGLPARLADENAVLGVEQPVGIGWMSQDLSPEGVVGNAAGADAARGSRLLSHLAERLVMLLRETAETPLGMLQRGPLQH